MTDIPDLSWHVRKLPGKEAMIDPEQRHAGPSAGPSQKIANTSENETFENVVARAFARRDLMRSVLVLSAAAGISGLGAKAATVDSPVRAGGTAAAADAGTREGGSGSSAELGFMPIAPSRADKVVVPDGYTHEVILKWGDPLFSGAPSFDINRQTAQAQAQQFGYNNDFVAYLPLQEGKGLLWVNHEYVNPRTMFPGFTSSGTLTEEQANIMMNAVGGTIAALDRTSAQLFSFQKNSRYNRRITLFTPMEITGPAKGHPLLRTPADPSGKKVYGTTANCAGGRTPWGTILTAEENFQHWFAHAGKVDFAAHDKTGFLEKVTKRYGISNGTGRYGLERYHERFDMSKVPNENHRFGWIVEVDPYDATSIPRKRTALGRFRHEGACCSLAKDGRVVVYMGDDQQFDYVYKFVSARKYQPRRRKANTHLLDKGTLYVAKFDVATDGSRVGKWIPLVAGKDPLTGKNGFFTQAEVCIATRVAADLVGATKMDRPEDIQRNEKTGAVYIALTGNKNRGKGKNTRDPNRDAFFPQEDPANPRVANAGGHVIECFEQNNDAAATSFVWNIFLLCGDPADASTHFAGFPTDEVSPIGNPDNFAFDAAGNLIVATDGQPRSLGYNDAFHFVPVEGAQRGHVQQFLSVPRGAEACGPEFTPDNRTMFCAVQHPGADGTVTTPTSTWPGGKFPQPAVIDIVKKDGGIIGS